MDSCHYELIYGAVRAFKPELTLELGYGSGILTQTILEALITNSFGLLDVVDNWYDWQYQKPHHIPDNIHPRVLLHTANESDFVHKSPPDKYDLIISDADHNNSHKWWRATMSMLKRDGIAFFHDVSNPMFPNLIRMAKEISAEYSTKLFDRSSEPTERCERGLLMVLK